MRDGIQLATDLYRPPAVPAPVIVVRTPYGRDWEAYGQAAARQLSQRWGPIIKASGIVLD